VQQTNRQPSTAGRPHTPQNAQCVGEPEDASALRRAIQPLVARVEKLEVTEKKRRHLGYLKEVFKADGKEAKTIKDQLRDLFTFRFKEKVASVLKDTDNPIVDPRMSLEDLKFRQAFYDLIDFTELAGILFPGLANEAKGDQRLPVLQWEATAMLVFKSDALNFYVRGYPSKVAHITDIADKEKRMQKLREVGVLRADSTLRAVCSLDLLAALEKVAEKAVADAHQHAINASMHTRVTTLEEFKRGVLAINALAPVAEKPADSESFVPFRGEARLVGESVPDAPQLTPTKRGAQVMAPTVGQTVQVTSDAKQFDEACRICDIDWEDDPDDARARKLGRVGKVEDLDEDTVLLDNGIFWVPIAALVAPEVPDAPQPTPTKRDAQVLDALQATPAKRTKEAAARSTLTPVQRFEQLEEARDRGLIRSDEYELKRAEILRDL